MSFVKPVRGQQFESTRQGFLYALSSRESSSNLKLPDYDKVNAIAQRIHSQGTRGYIGYFQFGEAALYDAGYFTVPYKEDTPEFRKAIFNNDWVGNWTGKNGVNSKTDFLQGRKHQLDAINFFIQRHCKKLRDNNFNEFYGKIVKGVELTESGCVAGSHLVGAKYVRQFALGEGDKTDGMGTHISEYINLFAHYDLESCCNIKIYIQVVKDKQPVEGKQVTVESEYDGKFHVGKLTNTYTTNAEGRIPVIVRHPGAKIKITIDGKSREIVQETDKKQSYIINLTDGVTVTAPLEKPSNPQPKPNPNQTPQEARNEQNSQSDKLSENEKQDVNFNIIMVEGDTRKPITNLKFFVTYKGKAKDKRTDNTGAVKGLVATVGQDIEISMQGENTLQPIHHFKVSKELEGRNVEVLLPVESFTIKVVNHKSTPVKNTNFILKYRGRSITRKTDNNGNISTKMLVGFVYKFCLANGQELITRRCLQGVNEKISINEVAYNLSQGKPAQNKPVQEISIVDKVYSFIKDNIPAFSLPSPTIVAKPSQSTKSSQVQKPPTTKPVAKAKPPAVKQNNTHTEKNGKPLSVITSGSKKEPSGAIWCKRYLQSTSTADLKSPFKENVESFISSMRNAGITVKVSTTHRPIERSYLMYYSAKIARGEIKSTNVPAFDGVNIDWTHNGNEVQAIQGAKAMLTTYGIGGNPIARPKRSNHNAKPALAIDMSLSNYSGKTIVLSGRSIKINSFNDLVEAGRSISVFWFGSSDKPHWSVNGK